jgi:uncharacterized protein YdaU (DUF1376 family)
VGVDWYKHDAKAFLEGTGDMTSSEVGIYIRLLDHQFCRGGYLPAEFDRLAALVAQDDSDRASLRNVLAMKFRCHKKGYCNLRMLQTVRKARQVVEQNRLNARSRWDADAMRPHERSESQRARARRASVSSSPSTSQQGGKEGVQGKPSGDELPEPLCTPEFEAAWSNWLDYRHEKRKPVSERAARSQLAKLARFGGAVAIEAIEASIANDWQGLFPEKANNSPARKRRPSPEDSDLTPTDYSYLDG